MKIIMLWNKILPFSLIIVILWLVFKINNECLPADRKLLNSQDNLNNNIPNSIIQEIIQHQKRLNELETKDYKFPEGTQLSDYTPSTNGRPIRSIIITTVRSGSSFLGAIFNAIPANFYFYEPLAVFRERHILRTQGPIAQQAISDLKRLLHCDYKGLKSFKYSTNKTKFIEKNKRLWTQCNSYDLCWSSSFLTDFCKLFPFQTMKITRLSLELAEEFLKDKLVNAKILLLIRDPRGILASRKRLNWCRKRPGCISSKLLCSDMVSNYKAAVILHKTYPGALATIRFEELALDPYNKTRELLEFFNLNFHSDVKSFLDSHTKEDEPGREDFSIHRDSKSVPFLWQTKLNASEIQSIEENCGEAMKLWGYKKIKDNTDLTNFNPLTSYPIK